MRQVLEITERRAVEETQAHLAAIVGSSIEAIVATDPQRRITAWNRGAERLFGHAHEQMIGREFGMLFPAEDRHRERDSLDRALAGDGSEPHSALMRTLDGALVEVSLSTSPIHDDSGRAVGASAIARDATGATAGAAAIHANEKRFRQIVETANEGIWTLDEEWNTTFANQKMADILRTTVEDMFGTSVFSYYDDDKRADARDALARRVEGQRDHFEASLRRRDGTEASVLMSASGLFDADGKVTGALAMVADITVRRQAEREVAQWQRLEGLGQLAGGVAHDMNNLLGVILNFSDFGLDVVGDGPGGEELTEIRQAAQRAAALTNQLLVFARQEVVSHQAVDINALLDELEKLLRRAIGENIVLVSRHGAALPAVRANHGFLEQVVINLVVNSRDAMPEGGRITITTALVSNDEDRVGTHGDLPVGDYVSLAVSDNGEGMTEGVAERAFEPFFTTKPVGSGTGLGLATVYGAVTKAGGRVELHSEVGEGTEVTILLPVASEGVELMVDTPVPRPVTRSAFASGPAIGQTASVGR